MLVMLVVKNPPVDAGATRDAGSIPGSGRSPGIGNGSILAWKIPWTEEPGGLQTMGSQMNKIQLSDSTTTVGLL